MLRVNSSKHINGKNSTTTIGKTWPKTETENISKKFQQGSLCGTVDKNPRASAGDKGSTPGPGVPHMPQLSPWAMATEPAL